MANETVVAYLESHRKYVAELFRPPAEPNAVFNCTFFQSSREGGLTDQRVRADFNQAISAVPGRQDMRASIWRYLTTLDGSGPASCSESSSWCSSHGTSQPNTSR